MKIIYTLKTMEYKNYTIIEDQRNPYGKLEFMFYLTEDGIQHDADYIDCGYKYTGNCEWADTLDEAKENIDIKIEESFTDEFGCVDHSALNIMERKWRNKEL